ncbi:MAG: CRTAC1 family protein, partial [Anaerolineae bacterium]|nr:CRTAC1 family protein [Anaerolineae bacterium]
DLLRSTATQDPFTCFSSVAGEYQSGCQAYHLLLSGTRLQPNREVCQLFPPAWEAFAFTCGLRFGNYPAASAAQRDEAIPQQRKFNVLLVRGADGSYQDRAVQFGVGTGGWSWNAKFADLNNDEWQDLYIANGSLSNRSRESNLFYINQGGVSFEEAAQSYGLSSHLPTHAFVYIDFDNDGDLDIITAPNNGPLTVFVNQAAQGNAIAFALRDRAGNRSGIGSKIIIHYGAQGSRQQMREIKASGGFISFDPQLAYFGLGEYAGVSRVEIIWSTGETSTLEGNFPAGGLYTISREG